MAKRGGLLLLEGTGNGVAMTRRTVALTDDLYDYLIDNSVRESAVLRRLRDETAKLEHAQMQISPEQGQFMALLVAAMGAKNALELGTFTGYSTLAVAAAMPEDGKLIACDIDEEWPSFGKRYWAEAGVGHKIELKIGPAIETLDDLLQDGMAGHFDFVFIDADKPGLDEYYERSLRLVRKGGVIAVDNTLWSGRVADPTVFDNATMAIRGFNVKVHDDQRVSMSLVPIGDGLTLLLKR